jgi:hypothetical protein
MSTKYAFAIRPARRRHLSALVILAALATAPLMSMAQNPAPAPELQTQPQ